MADPLIPEPEPAFIDDATAFAARLHADAGRLDAAAFVPMVRAVQS